MKLNHIHSSIQHSHSTADISAAGIATAYIGTVIGAGFASGQEIMQFFTVYGSIGIVTLILSGVIFSLLAYLIFQISFHFDITNYKDFIYKLCGPRLGLLYDILISAFLFLGTSIMFSGSGAIFEENLHWPKLAGIITIAALALLVVWQSLNGLLRINSIIVPVLLVVVFTVLITNLFSYAPHKTLIIENPVGAAPKAVFSLFYYCSYNIALSLGVLCAFSSKTRQTKVLLQGALLGGMGLMVLGFALNLCLLLYTPQVFQYAIPMLKVIKGFHPILQYLVMLCVWCEIFSTAVANLFSLTNRLSRSHPGRYKVIGTLLALACLPLSLVNFKKLIALFYPLFGALSLFLILLIFSFYIKNRTLLQRSHR